MKRTNLLHDHTVITDEDTITIRKNEGQITFRPGEAPAVTKLLHTASGMEKFETLPPHIESGQWRISFFADDTVTLERKDTRFAPLPVLWRDINNLVDVITSGVSMCLDQKKHSAGPQRHSGFSTSLNSGDAQVIEK